MKSFVDASRVQGKRKKLTHLFFPASYLLSFPSSLFTPWPPEANRKKKVENF